jgi:V8-like Glu-specific endopeptidase
MKVTHVNWQALAAFITFYQIIAFATLESRTAFAQRPPSAVSTGILTEKDRRVQIHSDQWPWSSVGRINVIAGTARGLCTGTLIAPAARADRSAVFV